MPSLGHSYSVTPEPPDIPTPESAARPADANAGFDAATYGDSFADVYDEWYPDVSDASATAEFVEMASSLLERISGSERSKVLPAVLKWLK